jgi:hypothetical protein
MKHSYIFFLFLLISISVFAQDNEAIAFNDKIVNEQIKIGEAILAFSDNPNDFSLKQIKIQSDKSINELNSMKVFDGNKKFLSAAKSLFKFYGEITNNEYKKILDLIQNKNKYTSEEVTTKITKLTESITKKESILDAGFKEAQQNFAAKYNFSLTKNELEERFKNKDGE